jgi:hypothetical protein
VSDIVEEFKHGMTQLMVTMVGYSPILAVEVALKLEKGCSCANRVSGKIADLSRKIYRSRVRDMALRKIITCATE